MACVDTDRIKILIVEDNSDDLLLLLDCLNESSEQCFETASCETLAAGIEHLASRQCDIVLLDLSLPDSFGIETVTSMQRRFPSLPIIVMTGNDDQQMAIQAIDAGVQDYLIKGQMLFPLLKRTIKYAIERQKIKMTEQKLLFAIDSAKLGLWDWDAQSNELKLDDGSFELLGINKDMRTLTLGVFIDCVFPADRKLVKNLFKRKGSFDFDFRVGSEVTFIRHIQMKGQVFSDEKGIALRISGICLDITERKLAEEALRVSESNLKSALEISQQLEHQAEQAQERSNQILKTVVEYAPTGVAMLDQELRFTSINQALLDLTGLQESDFLGEQLQTILSSIEIRRACFDVMCGKPATVARLPLPAATGEERYWDISLWPVKIDGEFTGAVMQISDRTHTVLVERQKDDFVASVAHDLKNPLLGASTLLEILCNEAAHAPAVNHERYLMSLKDSTQNLLTLVQNLVDVYRYETLAFPCHPEELMTSNLFESCIKQMSVFAESRDVDLSFEVESGAEVITADAIGIRRVLMNLLHNAVKFNRRSGKVSLSVKTEDGKTVLSVSDTGHGISYPEQQNLFQRFTQGEDGKNHSGGSGLGLFLSKQIVLAHGGSISCESDPGEGTKFVIDLPLPNAGAQAVGGR